MVKELCVQLVPLFQPFDYTHQVEFERLVHQAHFKRGTTLVTPATAGQLVIVKAGRVKVTRLTAAGDERLQAVLTTGDYIGEDWLFGESNPDLRLEAASDIQVCLLAASDLRRLLLASPQLSYLFLRYTIVHNTRLQHQIALLSLSRVEDRLLTYFADLAAQSETHTVTLPFALKDLAAYLGTTPETVSRKITQLEANGQLQQLGRGKYRLLTS